MIKAILTTSVLLMSAGVSAQVLKIDSLSELKLSAPVERVEMAPSGKYILLSNYNYCGLKKVDLSTQKETIVTKAQGAGYRVKMMDNDDIIYREVNYAPQKTISLKRFRNKTQASATIRKASTMNIQPIVDDENHVQTNEDFMLELTINGETRVLAPLGNDKRYIWPSISPDGKQLLFFVSGDGAYVCDMNGENARSIGILRAPKWYNNHCVVGQRDTDDGQVTTSSQIIAKNLITDVEQTLTNDNLIAMYPSVTKEGDKILFSTPDGRAYIIYIHVE